MSNKKAGLPTGFAEFNKNFIVIPPKGEAVGTMVLFGY